MKLIAEISLFVAIVLAPAAGVFWAVIGSRNDARAALAKAGVA